MARVIVEDTGVVNRYWQPWVKVIGIGAAVGLLYWVFTLLIGRYVVEPLACRDVAEAAACVNASVTAGKVSTVLVAALAVFGMIKFSIARPIIIAVAAAIILWSLSEWTRGMVWYESLLWSVVLYALVYALFGWIVRQINVVAALVIAIIVVVLLQIAFLIW